MNDRMRKDSDGMTSELSIDAVVTWVDGDDPVLRKKRETYLQGISSADNLDRRATLDTRFSASFELEYNLRLIRQNAPWLRTIFLITDNQCPDWLTASLRSRLGVQMVDHDVLFHGYEESLPTFNSRSIDTLLFNIPGLSERFIYLNDDFFVIRPTRPEDWFQGDKVMVRGRPYKFGKLQARQRKFHDRLSRRLLGARYVGGALGLFRERGILRQQSRRIIQLSHAPYALFRSALRDILVDSGLDQENSRFRFRSSEQVRPLTLALNQMVLRGQGELVKKRDWYYLNGEEHFNKRLGRRLAYCSKHPDFHSICINSIDQMSKSDQDLVQKFLDEFLE